MNIKEMKPQQWKTLKSSLERYLQDTAYKGIPSYNIKRIASDEIAFESSIKPPTTYNLSTGEVLLWGASSRGSRGSVSATEIVELKSKLNEWQFVNEDVFLGEE